MKKKDVIFWIVLLAISLSLFATEYFLLSKYEASIFGEKWNWGWAIFFAQISLTLLSIGIVGVGEQGAIVFLGRPVKNVKSGPVLVPWPLCWIRKETVNLINEEIPDDPEKIYRGDEPTAPKGYYLPIRVTFAAPENSDPKDPLNARLTLEVPAFFSYLIYDVGQFVQTIGSQEKVKKQAQDIVAGLVAEEFTKITPKKAFADLGKYSRMFRNRLEKIVKEQEWGIKIINAMIKQPQGTHELNRKISGAVEAGFQKQADITAGEGEREKRRLLGEGDGLAEKAVLDGRTAGLKKMKDELNISAEVIIGAETARAITSNPGQKTVIVEGFKDLIGVATGIGKTLKEAEKTGG